MFLSREILIIFTLCFSGCVLAASSKLMRIQSVQYQMCRRQRGPDERKTKLGIRER